MQKQNNTMNVDTENSATSFARRMSMDQLAHLETVPALWSDKRSKTPGTDYVGHDYLRFYDREWSKWRDEPIRMLEIGLNVGASIKLWLQYFSKAQIVGMDVVDFKFATEIEAFIMQQGLLNRFTFVKGNQFSPYDLQRFVEDQPLFDIIIDDGAHSSGPIIMSFQYLWGKVKPGGYYVIEDLEEVANPASHTPGYPNQVEFVKELLEQVIRGLNDVDEAFVSKELVMLRKKV